jgi:hypothetical protein
MARDLSRQSRRLESGESITLARSVYHRPVLPASRPVLTETGQITVHFPNLATRAESTVAPAEAAEFSGARNFDVSSTELHLAHDPLLELDTERPIQLVGDELGVQPVLELDLALHPALYPGAHIFAGLALLL